MFPKLCGKAVCPGYEAEESHPDGRFCMKTHRLIGIIDVLRQKKKVTAPYLAERFEVSRRTILRDIEALCRAGFPIVTTQGGGGGVALMDGYDIDTTVFTGDELTAIFTGLQSIDSVSHTPGADRLAVKSGENAVALSRHMMIDLSSFYKDDLADKIEQIRTAIRERRLIEFHYYYNKGEADKRVEPYLVVFKWSDWYVFGWCCERRDFRMYKLRRLWELRVADEPYTPREIPEEQKQFGGNMTDDFFITAIYEPSEKYRLVEEYGPGAFSVMEDGRLWTRWGFTDPDRALQRFLSFGDKVQIVDPPEMREKMRAAAARILEKYGELPPIF